MLNDQVFYNATIRKTIVAFGNLFSNIYVDRREGDSVKGPRIQRLQVPVAYAPKEKWLVRIEQDPKLENHTYTSLPRMSFEIVGYTYDAVRKINRMNNVSCISETGSRTIRTPAPWNLELSLYVLTKTQEDSLQILEQILPTFTPEYTIPIKSIPEMNIVDDIPIILNSVQSMDEYDGDFNTRRFVTLTLNFTIKLSIYGGISVGNPIYSSNANVAADPSFERISARYNASVDPETGNLTNDQWIEGMD